MAEPIPSSANDRTTRISVKTPDKPAYWIPNVRMKIDLVTKAANKAMILTRKPNAEFKIVYLVLAALTFYIIIKENSKLNMNLKYKILSCLFNPIFLATYLYCFIKAITTKEVAWEEIKHEKTQID